MLKNKIHFQPENIVLQNPLEKGKQIIDYGIKIIDFGTAKKILPGEKVQAIEGNFSNVRFLLINILNY